MSDWACPRSILFTPADKPELVQKAIKSSADAVCLDLEDGVAPQNKEAARGQLGNLVKMARDHARPIGVRINSDLANAGLDIHSLPDGLDHVVVPKVRGWSQLLMISEALQTHARNPGNCPAVIVMVEDLGSIQSLSNNAPGYGVRIIAALALGTEDLAADLGVTPNSDLLTLALYDLMKIGSSLDCPVLGFPNSIANFRDQTLLKESIQHARNLGSRGAFCIHPVQVGIINEGFSPTSSEIAWAEATLTVKEQIEQEGVAVHPLTQQMVDRPVLFQAQSIISRGSGSQGSST